MSINKFIHDAVTHIAFTFFYVVANMILHNVNMFLVC